MTGHPAPRLPRLPYVDCVQVSAEEIQISWTLPPTMPSLARTIVQVKDLENEDFREVGIVEKGLKYTYKGS